MSVLEYKCPCCGAVLKFNENTGKMLCEYCDNTFDVEELKEYEEQVLTQKESKFDWADYTSESGNGDWQEGETEQLKRYVCPSCAGEIIGDDTTSASRCPYCDSPAIFPEQLTGVFKPDYIIPFKKTKEDAKAAFLQNCKGKQLLPKFFTQESRVESIQGVYVPFWIFNCDADANVSYKGNVIKTWSDGKYNYVQKDTYLLTRGGNFVFSKIPADGSTKMNDEYMEAIEPYDYSELTDFTTAYLSGYMADKYDVDSTELRPKINQRIENGAMNMLRRTTTNYSGVSVCNKSMVINGSEVHYALFPVWILNTKYNEKIYTFMMNGQTGKFVGDLPICKKKSRIRFFAASLISFAVTATIALIYIL